MRQCSKKCVKLESFDLCTVWWRVDHQVCNKLYIFSCNLSEPATWQHRRSEDAAIELKECLQGCPVWEPELNSKSWKKDKRIFIIGLTFKRCVTMQMFWTIELMWPMKRVTNYILAINLDNEFATFIHAEINDDRFWFIVTVNVRTTLQSLVHLNCCERKRANRPADAKNLFINLWMFATDIWEAWCLS
jgi:hypothetical protein